MKVLKTEQATIINPTREDAKRSVEDLATWMYIYHNHSPHSVYLYEIEDGTDVEEEISNTDYLAKVDGFTHEEMSDRDPSLTPDEDADITTIISDNATDWIANDYDGRFGEFLANF
jgi:hypothetical protein